MEIIFNCPNCGQELAVDDAGAGSEIPCPTCSETITIPAKPTKAAPAPRRRSPAPSLAPSAMASSAAAKVEFHLKVPVPSTPSESLIRKATLPLEAVAKGADKQIRVRTIRHDKCVDSGHDKFDEITQSLRGHRRAQHQRRSLHQLRTLRRADAKGDDGLRAGDYLSRLIPACPP